MYVVDMHCDTISELYSGRHKKEGLGRNSLQVDIEKMLQGGYLLQNFAMFIELSNGENPYECCKGQIALFLREIEKNQSQMGLVKNYRDIMNNKVAGKLSAMLTIEEGQATEGSLKKLEEFYTLGARMMTFTWNYANVLGSPANAIHGQQEEYLHENNGLTEAGISILEKMEALGMIADTAHLSEEGFWDVCRYAKKPFVCSHGNARGLCNHPRNFTDQMIKEIGNRGGVIGVNYYGNFLYTHPVDGVYPSTAERIADHILYIMDKGGTSCVGLGSDFDGMDGELEISDCSKIEFLEQKLRKRGLHEREIEDIFYRNVLNLYQELLK